MLTTIKVDWWHRGVGCALHVLERLMFIHSTSALLIRYGVIDWSGRLKLGNLSKIHVESRFCLYFGQNYADIQTLRPYWTLSWCYTILHPSGKTFHKILETGCMDLLPFLQSAFRFIPKVLDGVEVRLLSSHILPLQTVSLWGNYHVQTEKGPPQTVATKWEGMVFCHVTVSMTSMRSP